MSADEDRELLADIAERQKSLRRELTAMAADHAQMFGSYSKNDADYREQLGRYTRDQEVLGLSRRISTVIQLISLILLAYIAYRVSQ